LYYISSKGKTQNKETELVAGLKISH